MALLPPATRSVSQPGSQPAATPFEAAYEAKVEIRNRNIVLNSSGVPVVMGRNTEIVLMDEQKRERARHRVPYGAKLLSDEGAMVAKGQKLAEWDPYPLPIIELTAGGAIQIDAEPGDDAASAAPLTFGGMSNNVAFVLGAFDDATDVDVFSFQMPAAGGGLLAVGVMPTGPDGAFVLDGLKAGEIYDLQLFGGVGVIGPGPSKKGIAAPAAGAPAKRGDRPVGRGRGRRQDGFEAIEQRIEAVDQGGKRAGGIGHRLSLQAIEGSPL